MKVANKKCIRRLAFRSIKASKTRNIVAIIAITLTTLLFTSLFTISMSIIDGYEQANFRQTGSYSHGEFKYLDKAQYETLKDASEIKEYGVRRVVGVAWDAPFNKETVEISYCDDKAAEYMYLVPENGTLPKEGTNEAATDKKVLELLGIEPVLGTEFTLTFEVDGTDVTKTFVLSGYWEADTLAPADHVLIPESRAEEIFSEVTSKGIAGTYNILFMLNNSSHIREKAIAVLNKYGYQSEELGAEGYVYLGCNNGYAAKIFSGTDIMDVFIIILILLIIFTTGYLVINNIFRISIANDIRRYGLLKTVGTTKKQIRKIIYIETAFLAAIGIPIGLLLGYLVGIVLTLFVTKRLNGISILVSVNPVIFIAAALFSLLTVFISCMKPAKFAARVSPIEALRYTDASGKYNKRRKKGKYVSPFRMAFANMGRNKSKTTVTIISLTLALLLLDVTVILTNSFDINKFLKDFKTDFMIGNADYFRVSGHLFNSDYMVAENVISDIEATGMVAEAGCTYGVGSEQYVYEYVPEEHYLDSFASYESEETINYFLENENQIDGMFEQNVQLYGMDDFCLQRLSILDGSLEKLNEKGNYIAAVYRTDDYGNPEEDSNWAKVGDMITIRYVKEVEWYNPDTGEVYCEDELEYLPADEPCWKRSVKYKDVIYEVCAVITIPKKMSYRYYMNDEFVLSAEELCKNAENAGIMYYAYNVTDENERTMEAYISEYTKNQMTEYDYESKQTYMDEYDSLKQMFIILGGVLSLIVGITGVLNFLNANLTSIAVRKHEFAVLQSVGMTGRQLKKMLMIEGLFYTAGSIAAAMILSVAAAPFMKRTIDRVLWFCSYQYTLVPILIMIPIFVLIGVGIPLIIYKKVIHQSLIERLREGE